MAAVSAFFCYNCCIGSNCLLMKIYINFSFSEIYLPSPILGSKTLWSFAKVVLFPKQTILNCCSSHKTKSWWQHLVEPSDLIAALKWTNAGKAIVCGWSGCVCHLGWCCFMNRKYIMFNMGSHGTVEVHCIRASSDTKKISSKVLLLSLLQFFYSLGALCWLTKVF